MHVGGTRKLTARDYYLMDLYVMTDQTVPVIHNVSIVLASFIQTDQPYVICVQYTHILHENVHTDNQ
jgi:hypothetical protein